MSQGYFYIALGKQYIDECELLVNTIRKNEDNRPVSLLIHKEDEEYARSKNMFDRYVYFNPSGALWNECSTGFEKYCLYPRIHFDDYLVYDETIITDSDVLCQAPTKNLWNYLKNQPYPIRMLGRKSDPNWHWGQINRVIQKFNRHVPHVHGGFFYFRKTAGDYSLGKFFSIAKMFFYAYDDLDCIRGFRGGRVDEIIFALTHSFLNIMPVEFDEKPVMTFNYTPDIMVPSKLQTEGGQNIELDDYIPFVHMFDKMGGVNFNSLYNKIMNGK
jgi:hypothetical protein